MLSMDSRLRGNDEVVTDLLLNTTYFRYASANCFD
jgi:hypothetical protein